MVDCSIIIVNYNVSYFLYQCLDSLQRATTDISAEIIVIDNASSDDSVQMIQNHFPFVQIIKNDKNVGFSRANNQGIQIAKGQYTLLLNPDTIVQENTITSCITYMKTNEINTGLGIRMINGSGQFLPESKRSFPSPAVAFYKLFGLSRFFPSSKTFGKYHLSYLPENKNHEVEVLSGAFFMAPTKVLQKENGFDEDFFMYGEDIDLSYRLIQEDKLNHYFAESKILHYKGESTKRGSLNYVLRFYRAMIIFARKHFKGKKAFLFILLLQFVIWFRAIFTFCKNIVQKRGLFIVDIILSFSSMVLVNHVWSYYKFRSPFPEYTLYVNLPIYTILFALTMYLCGAYDKPYSILRLIKGSLFGVIALAFVYAFFPEDYRFSRLFILFSGISVGVTYVLVRFVAEYMRTGKLFLYHQSLFRILVVSNSSRNFTSLSLFHRKDVMFLGVCSDDKNLHNICKLDVLPQFIEELSPTDIIIDTASIPYSSTLQLFEQYGKHSTIHTLLPIDDVIISSNHSNKEGNIYLPEQQYKIAKPLAKRSKRLFDIISSIFFLLGVPIGLMNDAYKTKIIPNLISVLLGKKTWIGYQDETLPTLAPFVFSIVSSSITNKEIADSIKNHYAQNYSWYVDFDWLIQRMRLKKI